MAKLLLIEDDALLRGQLAGGLSGAGHEVAEAGNGTDGVRLFRAAGPDLVITDIVMDQGEGLGTIIVLRRAAPALPILAMSGNPMYLDHGLKLGATEGLLKPFRMAALLAAVDRHARPAASGGCRLGRRPRRRRPPRSVPCRRR